MAIEVTIPTETPPSRVRIWKTVIDNGTDDPTPVAIWADAVYHEEEISEQVPVEKTVTVEHQEPILDIDGNPVLDGDGNPTYTVTYTTETVTEYITQTRVERTLVTPEGIAGYKAEFKQAPYVEVTIRGVEPMLSPADGVTPVLNPLGQPAYVNTNWVATIRMPAAELIDYLQIWEDMTTVSYGKVVEKLAANEVIWKKL